MAGINGEVCINSDSAIRVSRMVPQHKHKPDMHDSDQESRAAVTNIEMEKNNRKKKDSENKVVSLIDREIEFPEDTNKVWRIAYEKNEQIEKLSSECKKLQQLHVDQQKCSDGFRVVEQSDCNQQSSSSDKHTTRSRAKYRCMHGKMGRHLKNKKHRKREQTFRILESLMETGLVQLKGDSSNISCVMQDGEGTNQLQNQQSSNIIGQFDRIVQPESGCDCSSVSFTYKHDTGEGRINANIDIGVSHSWQEQPGCK
ncbi:MAG: hypothetical protein EZS28_048440 [Streblomastix strix]|uniref:Uncharacterized protein n=1 Tax=Streblomastix strix TaxID=222440 RepID=A0A5J4TE28_9EUKA|nr:MAG: hypothetical protein EZS28_048440 [Streblomastix strix]